MPAARRPLLPPIANMNARVGVRVNAAGGGTTEYLRRAVRFLAGSGISYTMVDDPTNEEVELTIASSGGGGGGGSTWYDGTGAPSGALGVDGDYYLDDATGDVYTKASGTWSVTANIKGPTGQTGATGATGPTGPSGIASLPTPYRNDGTYVIGHDPLGNVVWVPRWGIGYTLVLSGSQARTFGGGAFPSVEGAEAGDLDNVGAGGNNTTQTGGYYVQTSTTTNNVACYAAKTARASITSTPYLDCILRINNAASISAWWGLQSSGAWTTALADGVTADCLLLRYSTSASDTTLKIITANGTAQTVTDTTVGSASFTTPTDLYVSVEVNIAGTAMYYEVWNYPKTTLLKSGTITGTLPRSSVLLRAGFQCVTRTNANRWAAGFLRVGYLP